MKVLRAAAIYVVSFVLALIVALPLLIGSIYLVSLIPEQQQSPVLIYGIVIILTVIGVILGRWIRLRLQATWGADVQ